MLSKYVSVTEESSGKLEKYISVSFGLYEVLFTVNIMTGLYRKK